MKSVLQSAVATLLLATLAGGVLAQTRAECEKDYRPQVGQADGYCSEWHRILRNSTCARRHNP